MERFTRTLFDYGQDHQWVGMLGWTEDELRAVPIHGQATSHDTTTEADDYLNLANFGTTALGVSSQGSGGGTSAHVRSIQNVYVYRSDTPPHLYQRLQLLMDQGGPIPYAPEVLEEGQPGSGKAKQTRRGG